MAEVEAYSHNVFNKICEVQNITDDNVETKTNMAFISIIGTHGGLEHWFKTNHSNVLNLEFDDVESDIILDVDKDNDDDSIINVVNSYAITEKQALEIVEFIDRNVGKDFYIHCYAGVSRSGAICHFIKHNYDEYKNTQGGKHICPNNEVLRKLNRVLWKRYYKDVKKS